MKAQLSPDRTPEVSPLDDLLRFDEYRPSTPARERLFRSEEALRWFARRHRTELFEFGALKEIAGRLWISGQAFDRAVLVLGSSPRKTCGTAG